MIPVLHAGMPDTGWRNVTDPTYISAGTVTIRRVGLDVIVKFTNIITTATGGHPTLLVIPAGFRIEGVSDGMTSWNSNQFLGNVVSSATKWSLLGDNSNGLHSLAGPYSSAAAASGVGRWLTFESFPPPSMWPGVPA